MKKLLLSILCLFCVLSSTHAINFGVKTNVAAIETYILGFVNCGALNVRTGPWQSILGTVHLGDTVKVVGYSADKQWCQIDYNGKIAFVYKRYISGPGSQSPSSQGSSASTGKSPGFPFTGYTTASSLNVRQSPWGAIVDRFSMNTKVEVVDKQGDWYRIKHRSGYAWVHSDYVTRQAPGSGSSTTPPPVTNAGGSGGKALLGWLQQAGLTGETLKLAWSIGMAESGGNPNAHNGNSRTGDNSYGLFQINMIGSLGPARRKQFGISSDAQLLDPMTNIKAMKMVSSNYTNWKPWSVYKSGSYRKYYNQYPPR